MKKLVSVLAITLLAGLSAKAGVLFDPYFNYMTSGSSNIAPGASITGTEIGARLGWDFLGLGVGIDTLLSGKYSYSSAGVTTDATPSYLGIFVSFKFPILVRGYISYLTSAKETMPAGDYFSGKATKIGIQYTGLPFIAIGIETYSGSYDNYTSAAGASGPRSDTANHTNIALSVPFSF